jgi:hypothetical protein
MEALFWAPELPADKRYSGWASLQTFDPSIFRSGNVQVFSAGAPGALITAVAQIFRRNSRN